MICTSNQTRTWGLYLSLTIGLLSQAAEAIEIHLIPAPGIPSNHAQDPTGTQLQIIMEAAAAHWEEIFKGSGEVTINYGYSNLLNGTLGLTMPKNLYTSPPDECDIYFDTVAPSGADRAWYFDPTPTNHDEFEMHQELYGNLTAAQQNDWFSGTNVPLLEAGFMGFASPTAPVEAENGHDLLTVALHEIGHALGMMGHTALPETINDADFDFEPSLVWGNQVAAECFMEGGTVEWWHLAAGETNPATNEGWKVALMYSGLPEGQRVLPSATDVFAILAAVGWDPDQIDLPRKDFVSVGGSTNWNNTSNWSGNYVPDQEDDVFVRHGGTVCLSSDGSARNLLVSGDSEIFTGSHELRVHDILVLGQDGETGAVNVHSLGGALNVDDLVVNEGSFVDVQSEGLLFTDTGTVTINVGGKVSVANHGQMLADCVEINDGGELFVGAFGYAVVGDMDIRDGGLMKFQTLSEMYVTDIDIDAGGQLLLDDGGYVHASQIDIADGGYLWGSGTIEVSAGLTNRAVIASLGDLVLTATGAASIDLDGGGSGRVSARLGDLTINGPVDPVWGAIAVGSGDGQTLTFSDGWTLDPHGSLELEGTAASPATIAGGEALIRGPVTVDGMARFEADATFGSCADVSVADTADELRLNGKTTYDGGGFAGNGRIIQNGEAMVQACTVMNVGLYDWDGFEWQSPELAKTTVNGATFSIHAPQIDSDDPELDGYDGTMMLWDAALSVHTDGPWRLDGMMWMWNSTVEGQPMVVYGDIETVAPQSMSSVNTIDANVHFTSASSVHVGNISILVLDKATEYSGPTITGEGTIVQNGDAHVTGTTTIAVDVYDWDGNTEASTTTVDSGASLVINASRIEGTPKGTYDGTIDLRGDLAVNVPDLWQMDGMLRMTGPSTGGALLIDGSRVVVTGDVALTQGEARIRCASSFHSGANVRVGGGTTLVLEGDTTFRGGSYTGDGTIRQNGAVKVAEPTGLDVGIYDMDGNDGDTHVTVYNPFQLDVQGLDAFGNVFEGVLNITSPGRLIVNTPDAWEMAGTMNLDSNHLGVRSCLHGADVAISGQVNVTGKVGIDAGVDLTGIVSLGDVDDAILFASGAENTIRGGTISGLGSVLADGGSLSGHGTIAADVNFHDTADLLADGGVLAVTGEILAVGAIGTAAPGSVLSVTPAWNTHAAERLELNGGSVTGGIITNDGQTIGHGQILSSDFINNGTLTAEGGMLVLATVDFPKLDGAGSGDGIIDTGSETVHVPGDYGAVYNFNGELNIGPGGTFRMDHHGLFIGGDPTPGRMNLAGGTYVAPRFVQVGQLDVSSAPSTINSDSEFTHSSINTVDANLRLKGHALIRSGASFTGSASLVVADGATVDVEHGAHLDVSLINNGTLNLGCSPGIVSIAEDFTQELAGSLCIEFAGPDNSDPYSPQFDELLVGGTAFLGGTLELSLLDGFRPEYGDTFEILTAAAIEGVFDRVRCSKDLPGKCLSVLYDEETVTVVVALPGDVDLNGRVDLDDKLALKRNFGQAGRGWRGGDVDQDGQTGATDYLIWKANSGSSHGGPNVPEPATLTLVLLGGFVVTVVRRRRR